GEGPRLEFKEAFPKNAGELAKEIAAFATTEGGTILLGVSSDGALVGVLGLDDPVARDQLMRRIEGVCSGTVKPAITPDARFASEGDAVVVVITVPKGTEAVYYAAHIPYVRRLTASRPAEPHEVNELVRTWLAQRAVAPERVQSSSQTGDLLSAIGLILA